MKRFAVLLILGALLITTKQIVEVPDMDGIYPVIYKEICREDNYDKLLFKKNGILKFDDGTVIRDYHTITPVPSCP